MKKRQEALDDWADSVRSDAEDIINNQPYYNG